MRNTTLLLLLFLATSVFSQTPEKMRKNFSLVLLEPLSKTASFSFERLNPEKHGFEKVTSDFTISFVNNGLKVSSSPTDSSNHYKIVIDYHYIYKIAMYKMQYSDFRAQIINSKTGVVAGIISYKGNFDVDAIGEEIAKNFKSKAL